MPQGATPARRDPLLLAARTLSYAAFLLSTFTVVRTRSSPVRSSTRSTVVPERLLGTLRVTTNFPSSTLAVPSFLPPRVMLTLLTCRSRPRILSIFPARTFSLTRTFGVTGGTVVGGTVVGGTVVGGTVVGGGG